METGDRRGELVGAAVFGGGSLLRFRVCRVFFFFRVFVPVGERSIPPLPINLICPAFSTASASILAFRKSETHRHRVVDIQELESDDQKKSLPLPSEGDENREKTKIESEILFIFLRSFFRRRPSGFSPTVSISRALFSPRFSPSRCLSPP